MDKQDQLAAFLIPLVDSVEFRTAVGSCRTHFGKPEDMIAAAVRSFMGSILGFGTEHDASLNLQGALDDLRGQHDPNDGGVCAETIERVIGQIEAIRPLSAAIGEDIGGGRG